MFPGCGSFPALCFRVAWLSRLRVFGLRDFSGSVIRFPAALFFRVACRFPGRRVFTDGCPAGLRPGLAAVFFLRAAFPRFSFSVCSAIGLVPPKPVPPPGLSHLRARPVLFPWFAPSRVTGAGRFSPGFRIGGRGCSGCACRFSGPSGFCGRVSGGASARVGCRIFSGLPCPDFPFQPVPLSGLFRPRACPPPGLPWSLSLVCTLSGNRGRAVFAGFPDQREGAVRAALADFPGRRVFTDGSRRASAVGWLPPFYAAARAVFPVGRADSRRLWRAFRCVGCVGCVGRVGRVGRFGSGRSGRCFGRGYPGRRRAAVTGASSFRRRGCRGKRAGGPCPPVGYTPRRRPPPRARRGCKGCGS